jgi:hypothetical protein
MSSVLDTLGSFGTPAVTIVFALEERPRVIWDAISESEAQRLRDWVEAHDQYVDIVSAAWDLACEERAA